MTYGELQHNLLTGIPVFLDITYGAITSRTTVIQASGYALGYDNVSRATVVWTHPDFDNNQIDTVELSKLYTKTEEN